MAIITYCPECKTQTAHSSRGCVNCISKLYQESKEISLQSRAKLTVEERLTLLESETYDHYNKVRNEYF